jgi:hypothetical protein
MAPELLDPDDYNIPEEDAGRPTKASDIYSLAITIWEVGFFIHYASFSTLRKRRSIAARFLSRDIEVMRRL